MWSQVVTSEGMQEEVPTTTNTTTTSPGSPDMEEAAPAPPLCPAPAPPPLQRHLSVPGARASLGLVTVAATNRVCPWPEIDRRLEETSLVNKDR